MSWHSFFEQRHMYLGGQGSKIRAKNIEEREIFGRICDASPPSRRVERPFFTYGDQKPPSKEPNRPKGGGVPFRPEPFLAIFREKWPKTGPKFLLASIGRAK